MTSEPQSTPSGDCPRGATPRPRRYLTLSPDGRLLSIVRGKRAWVYAVEKLDPHPVVGTAAWRLTKKAGPSSEANRPVGWAYDVIDTEWGLSCDCRGFCRWNLCKHVSAIAALRRMGRLT